MVNLATSWEGEGVFRRALEGGDLDRARTALGRLAWLGADAPSRHVQLGRRLAGEGAVGEAMSEFQTSITLRPTGPAWRSVGRLHEEQGSWSKAIEAYAGALEIDEQDVEALYHTGLAWLRLGEPERALIPLEQAAQLAPTDRQIAAALERARRRTPQ